MFSTSTPSLAYVRGKTSASPKATHGCLPRVIEKLPGPPQRIDPKAVYSIMMQTLSVDLGERSYPIFIGDNLIANPDLFKPYIRDRQVCVVTNDTLAPLYLPVLQNTLAGFLLDTVVLPDGERFKNLDTLNRIFDILLQGRHSRTTTLVALGGGVVGDMTGFAAACYQRGVDFIQIPTTLLAQVDSSVGGKTGVNHVLGKNMIGAFHQPRCVVADTGVLATLPDRELAAGMAEVIKYGLIADKTFLQWLRDNIEKLVQRDQAALVHAILRSCQIKAEIVAGDEREQGLRAILNLGHTFGHAIETAQGYGNWLHGEAVAAGTVMAAELSLRLGWLADSDLALITDLFSRAGLPVKPPRDIATETFMSLMAVDKKVQSGKLRLVLLRSLGEAVIEQVGSGGVDVEGVKACIECCR